MRSFANGLVLGLIATIVALKTCDYSSPYDVAMEISIVAQEPPAKGAPRDFDAQVKCSVEKTPQGKSGTYSLLFYRCNDELRCVIMSHGEKSYHDMLKAAVGQVLLDTAGINATQAHKSIRIKWAIQ
jgi:hypothetical protein